MKINLRAKEGWIDEKVENKQKWNCDIDNEKLYVAPDGETVYCDKVHKEN